MNFNVIKRISFNFIYKKKIIIINIFIKKKLVFKFEYSNMNMLAYICSFSNVHKNRLFYNNVCCFLLSNFQSIQSRKIVVLH